ncbi:MAG: glycosyltransferase [Planctomycetes bacterium]|nr:glycosyltransferase [Planctomycetota bacterium]
MTAPRASFLSVVALVDNDAPRLDAFVAEVLAVLAATAADHELILVDDGSADASARECAAILARHECVRVLRLSRRHGPDVAVTAGLDSALGDMSVVMAVATDPPARIPDLVALAAGGADIVIGTTGARGRSLPRRMAWNLFHHVFRRATGFDLVRGASTLRLFNRRALNALTRHRQKTVHLRLLGCSVGFRTATLDYEPTGPARLRPWLGTLGEAVSMLVSQSPAPLRLVSWLGGFASLLNVGCMAWVVAANLWKDRVVEGWTTLSLQLAVMFFFLFTTLAVIAEYLAHAFEEVKDCPLYHVAEEASSSTALTDARRRNLCSLAAAGAPVPTPEDARESAPARRAA